MLTLKQISNLIRRSTEHYKSCLTTRNTIIDAFEFEFNRHVKLICKKQDYKQLPVGHELRVAVKNSLKKSRNMKKIQSDMIDIKNRIRAAQIDCKNNKKLYLETQCSLQQKSFDKAKAMIEKFEIRNEQRSKTK